MNVEYAILAEAVDVSPTGKFSMLGGGVETFSPPTYPFSVFMLYVIVRMQFTVDETEDAKNPHRFLLELYDPQGSNLLPSVTEREFTVSSHPAIDYDLPISYLFITALPNLKFDMPGKYIFRLLVDGEELKSLAVACLPPTRETPEEAEEVS